MKVESVPMGTHSLALLKIALILLITQEVLYQLSHSAKIQEFLKGK